MFLFPNAWGEVFVPFTVTFQEYCPVEAAMENLESDTDGTTPDHILYPVVGKPLVDHSKVGFYQIGDG